MALCDTLLRYPGGRCRKALKRHRCDNLEPGWSRPCGRPIASGEIYFDPRIAKERRGHYETMRICARCAGIPEPMPQLELWVSAPVESVDSSERRKRSK